MEVSNGTCIDRERSLGIYRRLRNETKEKDNREVKRKYKTRSDKAYTVIALSVETSLQINIAATTDPKEAWDILKNQVSFVSVTKMVRLTRNYYAATMQEGDDLMEHITLMTSLAQQLRELGEIISTQKFAIVILGSLPPSYNIYITSLDACKADDLDWDSIKSSLQKECIKIKEKKSGTSHDEALFTRNYPRNNRGRQQNQRHNNFHFHEQGNSNTAGRYKNDNYNANTRSQFNSSGRQNNASNVIMEMFMISE